MPRRKIDEPKHERLKEVFRVPGVRTTESKEESEPTRTSSFAWNTELTFYAVTGVLGFLALAVYLIVSAL